MQYCEHCRVHIRGNRKNCPLCQNILPNEDIKGEEVFPEIPVSYQYNVILRIMVFISISIIAVSIAISSIFSINKNWSMFLIAGIACIWVSLAMVIRKKHNIPKSIVWQLAVISVLALLWDWRTGWHGWSLDYVIPIACVVAMIVMYVTAKVMRLGVRDFSIYLLLDGLFGIIPIIFLIFGGLRVTYPSVICVMLSVLSLSAIILFEGENIKEELNKRMHI